MSGATTKRPVAATVLAVIQSVIAAMNVVVAVIVLLAMRSPEVAPHATEEAHAMGLNAVLVVVAALATTIAAVGLWRRWAVGWALTLKLGLIVAIGMLWGPVFDHDYMSGTDVAVTAEFAATVVLALMPVVRRWYIGHKTATRVAANSTQLKSGY